MKDDLKIAIGLQAKRARENAGLTQEELAEVIEKTKDAVSSIERGVNFPSFPTLAQICNATNVPMSFMLETAKKDSEIDAIVSRIGLIVRGMSIEEAQTVLAVLEMISQRKLSQK